MPTVTPDQLEVLADAAGGVAVVALGVAGAALLRVRRLGRPAAEVVDDPGLRAGLERQRGELAELRGQLQATQQELAVTRAELRDAIRHVAVVRYDAFADMGGRLSFSAALLDDSGDGVVITSINGRSETRTYAKGVGGGASEHQLSPEEHQAIAYATGRVPARPRRRPATPAPQEDASLVGGDSVEGFTVRP